MTTLYLIRHAQSRPLAHQPEREWRLSEVGTEQARGLVGVLGRLGVQRIYTSPYQRSRDTLSPFAAAHGLEVTLHEGLRERRIAGQWLADFREVWQRSWADFSHALEGGENSWTCRSRIADAVGAIARQHPGETIALGSHGNAIALFLHYVDATYGIEQASALRTPEIVKVVHRDDGFTWEKTFSAGAEFERLATDFRLTPGIVA